ncbi:unnamed protein product [Cochlearia groenlandica]
MSENFTAQLTSVEINANVANNIQNALTALLIKDKKIDADDQANAQRIDEESRKTHQIFEDLTARINDAVSTVRWPTLEISPRSEEPTWISPRRRPRYAQIRSIRRAEEQAKSETLQQALFPHTSRSEDQATPTCTRLNSQGTNPNQAGANVNVPRDNWEQPSNYRPSLESPRSTMPLTVTRPIQRETEHLEDLYCAFNDSTTMYDMKKILAEALRKMKSEVHQATSVAPEIDRLIEESLKTPFGNHLIDSPVKYPGKIKLPIYDGLSEIGDQDIGHLNIGDGAAGKRTIKQLLEIPSEQRSIEFLSSHLALERSAIWGDVLLSQRGGKTC